MLKSLHIKNFKAWADTGRIRMAPITVFFGTNSSGKTSLHQFLLLLKQTAASQDRRRVLHLGDKSSSVDLGVFSDIIFNHDTSESIQFDLSWDAPEELDLEDPHGGEQYSASEVAFSCSVGEGSNRQLRVDRFSYSLDNLSVGLARHEKGKYKLESTNFKPIRQLGRKWPLPGPTRFYGFPDEAVAYYQNTGLTGDLTLELERMLSSICYVGPLREYPQPIYRWSGEIPEHVGERGERAVESLLAARKRSLNKGPNTRYRPFEEAVARWLRDMGLINSFQAKPLGKGRKEYEVLVKTKPKSAEVKLTDVGFGVSQVLPLVVQCFYVPQNSVLIFEQPEIHLHPRVQADLADLFIEALRCREKKLGERNIQLIVESHSEHFLRRLQRRVAEGRLDTDDVALYFCDIEGDRGVLSELQVDLFGRIENWPDDFFGDLVGETGAQMQAMINRLKESGNE